MGPLPRAQWVHQEAVNPWQLRKAVEGPCPARAARDLRSRDHPARFHRPPPLTARSPQHPGRKYDGDALWLPNTTRPEWLDGTLPGDRGFDPLGLSRPSDFVQIGVDENDINAPKNFKGDVEGKAATVADIVSETSLSPYSEVFGLQRFRETELIHGRWAMLGVLGALVAEGATGQSWWVGGPRAACAGGGVRGSGHPPRCCGRGLQRHARQPLGIGPCRCGAPAPASNCGPAQHASDPASPAPPGFRNRVECFSSELSGTPQYFGLDLPWSLSTAAVANSVLMGGVEIFRNSELDTEKRLYPGGFFDPLNLADPANPERAFSLKTAEIKHGRLAMVAALGFAVQAGFQGEGALGSLSKFGGSF
jgi:hypothetical protein